MLFVLFKHKKLLLHQRGRKKKNRTKIQKKKPNYVVSGAPNQEMKFINANLS